MRKATHPRTVSKGVASAKSKQGGMVKDMKQPGKLPPHHCKEHKAR